MTKISLLPLLESIHDHASQQKICRRELLYLPSEPLLAQSEQKHLMDNADPAILQNWFHQKHAVCWTPQDTFVFTEVVTALQATEAESVQTDEVQNHMQYGCEFWSLSDTRMAGFYVAADLQHGFLYRWGEVDIAVRWHGAFSRWLQQYWHTHAE